MDKFIVRFSILCLNIYMVIVLISALYGIDISIYDYIFTDSLLFGIVLTTLVHVQGKYHCVWIRALCYNLIIIPIVNYIDFRYSLFATAEGYIYFCCSILLLAIMTTMILAIRHFTKVNKIKRAHNEIRQRNRR